MNRSRPTFIRHVQIHALLEEHSGTFRVSVQRRYMHQSRAVLRSFEDARFEFIGQQLDDGSVAVLRGQVHRRAILMIGDGRGRSDAVKIFHQSFVAFGARYVQRGLPIALKQTLHAEISLKFTKKLQQSKKLIILQNYTYVCVIFITCKKRLIDKTCVYIF